MVGRVDEEPSPVFCSETHFLLVSIDLQGAAEAFHFHEFQFSSVEEHLGVHDSLLQGFRAHIKLVHNVCFLLAAFLFYPQGDRPPPSRCSWGEHNYYFKPI